MEWWDELVNALGGSGGGELDAAMMAAGSTPVTYNPTDYGGLDAAMMAAGSTPVSYGGASAGAPFYLDPRFLQGAGSLIGGVSQAYAGQRAAGTQADAINRAIDLQAQQRREDIARLQPRLDAGNNALAQMQGGAFAQPAAFKFGAGDYQEDPGYAFRLAEGDKLLKRRQSVGGNLFSSQALRNAQEYGQGMASQEFGNAYQRAIDAYNADVARSNTGYNRLAGLADVGQTAGTQIGTAGQNYATNAGNLMGQAGQATAAGQLGIGNTANNLAGAFANQYNTNQMMDILRDTRRSAYGGA